MVRRTPVIDFLSLSPPFGPARPQVATPGIERLGSSPAAGAPGGMLANIFPAQGGMLGGGQGLQSPQQLGLLAIAAELMAAGGPSRQRVTLGQALGRGLQAGIPLYQQGMQQAMQQRLMNAQLEGQAQERQLAQERMGLEREEFGLKRGELEQKQAQRAQQQQFLETIPEGDRALAALAPEQYIGSLMKSRVPDLPSGMRMGPGGPEWIPGYLEGQKAVRAAGRPAVTVQNLQEREESKTVGKFYGDMFANIQQGGIAAAQKVDKIDRLNQLLDQVNTGRFAGKALEVKKIAKSAGIDLEKYGISDDVAAAEAAAALSNEMALEMRSPSGGAGMPGALSDQDREFLRSMVPGIETTPEGRKMMLETNKRLAQRSKEVAHIARDYRKKVGQLDEGFLAKLQENSERKPLFGDLAPLAVPAPAAAAPIPEAVAAPAPAPLGPPPPVTGEVGQGVTVPVYDATNPWAGKSDQEVLDELKRKGYMK